MKVQEEHILINLSQTLVKQTAVLEEVTNNSFILIQNYVNFTQHFGS